jgi:uracil-DNA glycosylase family 4
LLDKMIAGMGFTRQQVYIANIIKCRACIGGPPAQDRTPAAEEIQACWPYLQRQVDIIQPRVIVTLGAPAAKQILQSNSTMGRLRGNWGHWRGVKVMPTYHPSYILRAYSHDSPDAVKKLREEVWSDLKKVLAELGRAVPARQAEA